jgi:hypothetical protein
MAPNRASFLGRAFLSAAFLALATFCFAAEPPKAKVTVTVTGPHENAPEVVIDGKFLEKGSEWTDAGCLYWNGTEPSAVLDLGATRLIEDIVIQVDNNDDYTVEACEEGKKTWMPLFVVKASYGEVGGGMDTFSTVKGEADYQAGIDFKPVTARYVRVRATDGDDMYSVSEIKVLSKDPPKK